MSAKAEARETAYRTWCECGQNLSETERRLGRDHDLPVSRQTLTEWCEKYDWKNRAARAEAAITERREASGDDTMFDSLLQQKTRYEEYFESFPVGKVDNQALFAYSRLLKTLVELRQSMAERKIREVREELSRLTAEFAGKPQKEALESLVNIAIAVAATGMVDGSVPVKVNLGQLIKTVQTSPVSADPAEAEAKSGSEPGLSAETANEIRRKILGIKS